MHVCMSRRKDPVPVQEESEAHSIESLPQKGGEDHEMVVMNPNVVVLWTDDFHHFICENLIGRHVGLPKRAIEPPIMLRGEGELVVEYGPKLLFAETQVESAVHTHHPLLRLDPYMEIRT